MSPTVRQTTMLGLLAFCLAGVAANRWMFLQASRTTAQQAEDDLQDVNRVAGYITAMRHRPAIAGSREIEIEELSQRIEQVAKEAHVASGSIVRIWPEPARRVADSPYLEKPIQVLLRNVDLKQIMSFLHGASSGSQALSVKSLRIVTPHHQDEAALWTAEVTLAYLIFQPPPSGNLGDSRRAGTSDNSERAVTPTPTDSQ